MPIDCDGFEVNPGGAFDQLRHYGAGDAIVTMHLLRALNALIRMTDGFANHEHLIAMAKLAVDETHAQLLPEADPARIMTAAPWVIPATG